MNYSNSNLSDEFSSNIDGDVREYVAVTTTQNIANTYSGADGENDDFYGASGIFSKKKATKTTSKSQDFGSVSDAEYKKYDKKKTVKAKKEGFFDKALSFGKDLLAQKQNATNNLMPNTGGGQETPPTATPETSKEGMSMGVKIAIGVGVVAVIGTIVYFATKKK